MEHFGIWGIIPPLLAIALALITKEVIISLFLGALSATLIVSYGNPFLALTIFTDKLADMVSDSWNIRILLFCALLGAFVAMFAKTGATSAFGSWASKFLKTKRQVMLFSWFFGILIFIDDYFNSLAVGTIMRPATDEKKISRAKLAYIIDSTAAPICIIAPISTWVVTIISYIRDSAGFNALGVNEFVFFLKVIPYNIYAVLTILFVFLIIMTKKDFGPMLKSERNAENGKLFDEEKYGPCAGSLEMENKFNAKWFDMIVSIVILIVVCVAMFPVTTWMTAVGGDGGYASFKEAFSGITIYQAFIDTDASKALFYGAVISLVLVYIYYLSRRLLTVKEAGGAIVEGVKSMVPALIVLALAWTIGNTIRSTPADNGLGLAIFLSETISGDSFPLWLLPAILYILACLISFSTGTSWGTFGIMVPIAIAIADALGRSNGFDDVQLLNILLISVGAVVSGAIFGDHCSPISDTTILSATGANCPLLEHITTQMPYALLVATSSLAGIIVASITLNPLVALLTGMSVMIILMFVIPKFLSSFEK